MNRTRSRLALLSCLLIGWWSNAGAQYNGFKYSRSVNGVSDQWHTLTLPDDLFSKTNRDFSDLRIIGIAANNDTAEAPYLLRVLTETSMQKQRTFKRLNESRNALGFYYTFELDDPQDINRIDLSFNETNFDWKIKLEASDDQRNWFTVLDDYRVLSIRNADTDYRFTSLRFPPSRYRFYRVLVRSDKDPKLADAIITQNALVAGTYRTYATADSVRHDKSAKQTVVLLRLPQAVPVSFVQLDVSSPFDYYRAVTIDALVDSTRTADGWLYSFQTLHHGTLSSLEDNAFTFNNFVTSLVRVTVRNADNKPLSFSRFTIKGNVHRLVARFDDPAQYHLLYGNARAVNPSYDIAMFEKNIPEETKDVTLGPEVLRSLTTAQPKAPLFENELWLWIAMGLVIVLLGVFTLKMMRSR